MDDKKIEELINKALNEDLALPEGLSERLEKHIDSFANRNERMKPAPKPGEQPSPRRYTLYWLSGIAVALLCAVLFIFTETNHPTSRLADTYNDPKEAAIAAQNALAFMSSNLNKGLIQVNEAGQEMDKINKIVNKHLNE